MIDPATVPIAELLPHGPGMALIDQLLAYDPGKSIGAVLVRRDSRFFDRTGVPAWVGIEYMAQTIAAHAGFEARLRGKPPSIGFLLGTRSYECCAIEFPLGAALEIVVIPLYVEDGLGSFDCTIEHNGVLARAIVSTYQPKHDEVVNLKGRREPT